MRGGRRRLNIVMDHSEGAGGGRGCMRGIRGIVPYNKVVVHWPSFWFTTLSRHGGGIAT
jgi:hypothetical protein